MDLSQRLSRAIGDGRARLLSLTGNFLDAETAAGWGLVAIVVPPDKLRETALSVANDMASVSPAMVQAYKALIDEGFALGFGAAMMLEQERSLAANSTLGTELLEKNRRHVLERGRRQ